MPPTKILVVDDEADLQRLIRQRFRRKIQAQEMDFIFASDGVEGLHKLQRNRTIDMVLADIHMPRMNGITFIHHVSRIDDTLKAVVISAYNDISHIRQAMNEGAFDFLTKPLDFQELEKTIRKTVQIVRQLKNKRIQAQKFQDALCRAAFYDEITGLPNRAWLYNHLEYLLKQRKTPMRGYAALLFIDLDGFKQVNDQLGHFTGDLLLQTVAQRLRLCLREGDFAARLGGDEFVVVIESLHDCALAITVAERIQMQLTKPFYLPQGVVTIGASIGIALNDKEHQHPERFLQEADMAMYSAKARGKGQYAIYKSTFDWG